MGEEERLEFPVRRRQNDQSHAGAKINVTIKVQIIQVRVRTLVAARKHCWLISVATRPRNAHAMRLLNANGIIIHSSIIGHARGHRQRLEALSEVEIT